MQAALPRLLELERIHGSVALGLATGAMTPAGAPALPPLVSFREGMGALPLALAARAGRIRTGTSVQGISRGPHQRWQVWLAGGDVLDADAVILAAPAWASAAMLEGLDPDLAARLGAIDHGRATSVTMAFARADVPDPLAGTGFVVPAREDRALAACTWSSRKFPGRAPDDVALLRCFAADHDAPDADLIAAVQGDLRDLLGIEAEPTLVRVRRLSRGLPRYEVGHLGRIAALEERVAALGAVALAGNAYRGLGVIDCLASGERAAHQVLAALGDPTPMGLA
jgi:protoporphyrinogen/coproporphyrinogen III oxidase